MVRMLVFATWLASSAVSAGSLRAALDPSTVALGEPLKLTLTATDLSLDTLDITPLTRQFDVFSRTLSRGGNSETLVLTLYSRVVGSVLIPPLKVGTSQTTALNVTVLNGNESVPEVSARWTLEPREPWVNQPARLRLSICDDDSLQWERPSLPVASGRLMRQLGEGTGEGMLGDRRCSLHHYDWSLIATQSGTFTLEAPMLNATRFGQRLRFPGTMLAYQVQALPTWLPAHVPPVKPQVSQDAMPQTWPLNRPLSWRFQVTGGYSVEGLKALLDLQLRESTTLRFYPPMITPASLDDTTSPLTRLDVTVHLQPRQRGTMQLPVVRFPWYDPARGQIADVVLKSSAVSVHDPRWTLVGWGAAGLAGSVLLAAGLWLTSRMVRWRWARRRGLQRISEAQSLATLAQAVRQFSVTDAPTTCSLGEWVRQMDREVRRCEIRPAVTQLEQQQFGLAAPNLANLRQVFLTALKRVRPTSLKSLAYRKQP